MGIAKTFKDMANVQFMKYRVASQKGRVTKLENEVGKLQFLIKDNILSMTDAAASYKGNAYPSYAEAVAEIDRKYRGVADWGVVQTGNIIDLRAAFTIGDGITVSAKEEGAELELEWMERFLEYNDLDREVAQEFAKEAEIEGKIALKLALEKDKDAEKKEDAFMVSVRYISWTDKKYEIISNPADYLDYQELKWKATGKTKAETLVAKEFVYKKFGGRITNPNEAAPKTMKCLTQIEGLDKAERDWRQINHIFAGPILYAECEDKKTVELALAAMADKNFKLNKALAGTFKFYFLTLDIKGVESIEREIISSIKMISGTTGIPVSFLGFVDLMSNRATAESLIDMINAGTTKERQTWIGAYEEVIRKAMVMWNGKASQGVKPSQMSKEKQLDPNKIKVDIPMITQKHYDRLEKIFLPLYLAGKLSDETFFTMIPGLDVKAEMERKAENEKDELERIKVENEGLRNQGNENPFMGDGE